MIDKDEIGQTLIPEDIILEDETSGFLACKATGDGDCLFQSAKSEKKESLQKGVLTKRLHLKEDSSDESSSEESSEENLL